MRLARKLTALLLLGIGAVFVIHTVVSIRSHVELYRTDVRRDERVMGRAMAAAITAAWKVQGPAAAIALLEEVNQEDNNVTLRWVHLPGGEVTGSDLPLAPDILEQLLRGEQVTLIGSGADGDDVVHTFTSVHFGGELVGAIELAEPLGEQRYLSWRVRRQLVTAAAMVLVCGMLSWIVGARVVGRPSQRLVEKARRIGAGDFSEPLILEQNDELADLGREMNAMAEQLDLALRKLTEETGARVAAVEQLRHADRLTTTGELASGIAHELGTPLNVVSGRAKMILSGEVEGSEEIGRTARVIVEQTERMTHIVRQLLDFARRGSSEKRVTDLTQLARQTTTLLEPLAAKRGVRLVCPDPMPPVLAEVDLGQLLQALTNLVVNAIQATSQGGQVAVRVVPHERAPAGGRADPTGRYVELCVRDDGAGIPPDKLPAVFDPFFTTKPVGEGTGLGLSVAYGIVREHGGWIQAESEPGRGSTFSIWLPREIRSERPAPDRR